LIAALDSGDSTLVPLARQMLIEGLPRLTTDESDRFSLAARGALASALQTTTDPEFAIAVLAGFRKIGLETELAVMDQAAQGHLVNLPKPQRERVAQLALTASAVVRLRLVKTMVNARVEASAGAFELSVAELPEEEVRVQTQGIS